MGKISKVFYKVIPPEVYTVEEAAEYFFHANVIDIDPMFHAAYEEYELRQNHARSKVIADALANGELKNPNMSAIMLIISSMQNAPVITLKE